jgi:F-type H+-transporting ATPase subunit epsilon
MPALFDFEVHTPYRLFYSGKAQAVVLAIEDGEICIYANHALMAAPVLECILRIKDAAGEWRYAFVSSGILEVKKKKNVLVVDAAEWPEEIDRERVLESQRQAHEDLSYANFKFETDKTRSKLRRAEYRLKLLEFVEKQA